MPHELKCDKELYPFINKYYTYVVPFDNSMFFSFNVDKSEECISWSNIKRYIIRSPDRKVDAASVVSLRPYII